MLPFFTSRVQSYLFYRRANSREGVREILYIRQARDADGSWFHEENALYNLVAGKDTASSGAHRGGRGLGTLQRRGFVKGKEN